MLKKIILSLIYIFLISCSHLQKENSKLLEFLPRETEVPGWNLKDIPEYISKSEIKLHNKLYFKYGAIGAAKSEYYSVSNKKIKLCVEVIKFTSSLNSFSFFTYKRNGIGKIYRNEERFYSTKNGMYFINGKFFIRIEMTKGNNVRNSISLFYSIISEKLKGHFIDIVFPDYMFLFSSKKTTLNLIYYIPGIDQILGSRDVFIRDKKMFDKTFKVFYFKRKSKYDAIEYYNSLMMSKDNQFIVTKSREINIALKLTKAKDYIFLTVYKDYIFGVLNADTINNGHLAVYKLYNELKENLKK